MAGGKPGRPKGSKNFDSLRVLRKLEIDHNFDAIGEIMGIYKRNKKIYVPLAEKIVANLENNMPATFGMTPDELNLYTNLSREQLDILFRLCNFMFPKLKAMQVEQGASEGIVFNVQIAGGDRAPQDKKMLANDSGRGSDAVVEVSTKTGPVTIDLDPDEDDDD